MFQGSAAAPSGTSPVELGTPDIFFLVINKANDLPVGTIYSSEDDETGKPHALGPDTFLKMLTSPLRTGNL